MGKGIVAIIDDDRDILDVCTEILQDKGLEVLSYDQPRELLKAFAAGQRAEVLITDYRMPDLNGLELITALRSQKIHIPAILLTGVADKQLAMNALNSGCHFIIEKPPRNQELVHYTEQALVYGRWEGISDRLLKECSLLIKLLKDQTQNYESRLHQAESVIYLNKSGTSLNPDDIQAYLKNISSGLSIEEAVQKSTQTMEGLAQEQRVLKTVLRKTI